MTVKEVLKELRIEFREEGHHHCRPGWIQICCPWCDRNGRKFHLGCHLALKYWNCWRCGGHSMVSVLMKLGLDFSRAQEQARTLDTSRAQKRERQRVSLKVPAGIDVMQDAHRQYLLSREFDPAEIERIWHVKGIGIHPRLGWRLFIPIEEESEVVSWTTRAISNDVNQRYISASAEEEAINHKEVLYGSDYCHSTIIVCEGPTDVWKIGPGAVATFGLAFSEIQISKMLKFPYRIICFDNEHNAQTRAHELAACLSAFPGQTMNIQLDAADPGSASAEEIAELRVHARI
jgi:hypothetical protein